MSTTYRVSSRSAAAAVAVAVAALGCAGGGGSGSGGAPQIALSSDALVFSAESGGAAPEAQVVTVTNAGGGALAAPTLEVSYTTGTDWLATAVAGERPPFTITVQPVVRALASGTYSALVSVRSNGAANTPRALAVTLTVRDGGPHPALAVSDTGVVFSTRSFGPAPDPRHLTVTNAGTGDLPRPAVTVTYAAPATGWLDAQVSGDAPPYTITVAPRASATALGAGSYGAKVRVESAGAGSAIDVDVILTLTPTWTVFVYGAGDGVLSGALLSAISDMGQAPLTADVNVVVAADFSAGRTLPGGVPYGTGTWWFQIRGGGLAPELLVHDPTEANTTDPDVLSAFTANALDAYPADRVAVVLWGAGASWRGFGSDEQDTPGDATDDGAPIPPAQLAAALGSALRAVGRTRLDLLAFEGGTMSSAEVALDLTGIADVLVATAELEAAGWDWSTTLGRLASDPSATGAALAAGEVADWDLRHSGALDALLRAHVAIDLSKVQAYADATRALGTAMLGSATPDWLDVARRQFRAAPAYGVDVPGAVDPRPAFRDGGQLLDALGSVASDAGIVAAATDARQALDAAVLASALGRVRRGASQSGVRVEASLGARWTDADAYGRLTWGSETGWGDVLSSVAANVDSFPLEVDTVALNLSSPSVATPPTIRAGSPDADVAAARLYVARKDGARLLSYGVVADVELEPGVDRDLVWQGTVPTLRAGGVAVEVGLRPFVAGSLAVHLAPAEIDDGVGSVQAWAIVVEGAGVSAVAFPSRGGLDVLPLDAFRGLRFTPLLHDDAAGDWVRASTSLTIPDAPGASLGLERVPASAGSYRLTTQLSDVWGGGASSTNDLTLVAPFGS